MNRLLSLLLLPLLTPALPAQDKAPPVDFARQIRPILSDNCFRCHGPDIEERKAKLRLDTKQGAFAKLRSGERAIVPGKPGESELLVRILAEDPHERMPPPKTNKKLTKQQVDLVKQWIEQGAKWSEHWAFVAPVRPAYPKLAREGWARNGIDHFILARLEKEKLEPSPEADRATLIRRLTLDLLGLPPTPAEVDAFLADTSTKAYEKLVDRLLASPHFGERLALDWLDASRFADTHGYHIDAGRDMSAWREWVIDAFNNNLPFDQFTVEQLAGDLLPNATVRQKVASGFNRNHMINFEGGAIPAEYHNAYIVDRVNTTSTVWLGLTLACAQCHDHKYDPVSHKDFYRFYAFFHNVPENGLDGSQGNASPMIKAPSRDQQQKLAELDKEIAGLEKQLLAPQPEADTAQAAWEKAVLAAAPTAWRSPQPTALVSKNGAKLAAEKDGAILVSGPNPAHDVYVITADVDLKNISALRLDTLTHPSLTAGGPGRSSNGNIVLSNVRVDLQQAGKPMPIKIQSATADFSQKDYPIANAVDADPRSGWAIHPEVGKPHWAIFKFAQPLQSHGKATLTVTLEFESPVAQHQLGHFRLSFTDAADPLGKHLPEDILAVLRSPAEQRTEAGQAALRKYYRENVAPQSTATHTQIQKLRQVRQQLETQFASTMIMQEMAAPRDTFVLMRGEYDKKGEKVTAGIPAALPPLPADSPSNRLGLARWLVGPDHPLTSRVIVNRYWQLFFGTGLVKTAEDFGSQAEPPSHPELLDWLAVEFMNPSPAPLGTGAEGHWKVKEMLRLIVTSATYRQASKVTADLRSRDPENRLLARGPRFRLQAEFLRDQALAVSGLLNREIGGKSVFPYQPEGLWQELASRGDSKNWSAQFYTPSKGKDLYRRTMYTFWKRTSPPPSLATLDAPDREVCVVRRARTNTPLQALILMNDPTYVEASRKLAERLLNEAKTKDDRITLAFRLATARLPTAKETAILAQIYDSQLAKYQKDPQAATKLLGVGESPRDERLPPAEVAAWAIVSSVILNLDESLTKN